MKKLFKLAVLLLIGYLLYRLYTAYCRPTAVRLDQQPAAVPPAREQRPASAPSADRPPPASEKGRISLNQAGAAALMSLPGIGPALADRIIAFRDQNGYFESVDDLARVQGIGPNQVERLRPLVAL